MAVSPSSAISSKRSQNSTKFLTKNPLSKDGRGNDLTPKEGSELLGARIVGRWKCGAPIDKSPFQDDPALGADSKRYINIVLCKHPGETDRFDLLNRNNDFAYVNERASPLRCPYAAHVRKTNPRDDLEVLPPGIKIPFTVESRRIMRRGIPFGPELTKAEQESGKTIHGRGLLFNCYQTSITNGFQFIQQCESLFFDCFSWSSPVLLGPGPGGKWTGPWGQTRVGPGPDLYFQFSVSQVILYIHSNITIQYYLFVTVFQEKKRSLKLFITSHLQA